MNATEIKLAYSIAEEENAVLPVIVVAAGSSSRMQGINKQYAELLGIPVIIRTLSAFERCGVISRIILVAREEDIPSFQLMAENYNITKLTDIVCGGKNRGESVLNGFKRLSQNEKKVLIHDGARPLVEDAVIRRVAKALEDNPAVTCAVRVTDTIKQVDSDGVVINTPPRESLAAVQTPQGVAVDEYLQAAEKSGDVSAFTDDMSVMESAGCRVITVEGSLRNIKITTPGDIKIAECCLSEEE